MDPKKKLKDISCKAEISGSPYQKITSSTSFKHEFNMKGKDEKLNSVLPSNSLKKTSSCITCQSIQSDYEIKN